VCGVSECDREARKIRRPWPTGGCRAMEKKISERKTLFHVELRPRDS
jgi:hypothetical protein